MMPKPCAMESGFVRLPSRPANYKQRDIPRAPDLFTQTVFLTVALLGAWLLRRLPMKLPNRLPLVVPRPAAILMSARLVGQGLPRPSGQLVVVETSSAPTDTGASRVATAANDGIHAVVPAMAGTQAINPSLYPQSQREKLTTWSTCGLRTSIPKCAGGSTKSKHRSNRWRAGELRARARTGMSYGSPAWLHRASRASCSRAPPNPTWFTRLQGQRPALTDLIGG